MSNQVIIQNAVKRYGDFTALNGVSLDIQEGEFFTLLGPSGCGKTTLLRMIAGFNSIEGGDFYFGEKRINDVPAHKRDIGMVFQNYAIFPHLTVRKNVEFGLKNKKLPKAQIAGKSLMDWGAIVVVPNIMTAVAIANRVAPEHLELCVRDPWALLPHIRHAGAIFMGQHSPEPVGDYFAGPNHVLPTLRTARFSSALSVQNFCKKTSIVATSPAFLLENAPAIASLARLEGLEAHARSVEIRSKR